MESEENDTEGAGNGSAKDVGDDGDADEEWGDQADANDAADAA